MSLAIPRRPQLGWAFEVGTSKAVHRDDGDNIMEWKGQWCIYAALRPRCDCVCVNCIQELLVSADWGQAVSVKRGTRETVTCFFVLLQTIFGTKQLTLVGREERAILAKTCSNLLTAEVCENEIFLIGGYNKKNLNMVGILSLPGHSDPHL